MTDVLLIQLPIPRLNYGRRTGNVPLAAACLKQAATDIADVRIDVLPESVASFVGDAALLSLIEERRPDVIGFSAFSWNIDRVLYLSRRLKSTLAARIILGGPEITRDNPRILSADIDFYVYGDGEAVFRRLLLDQNFWQKRQAAEPAADWFRASPSPYLSGGLEPQIENIMLLETQRGCPYHCAFCYYNKSHTTLVFADRARVIEAVQWACDQGVDELFLLDPSLNVRPDLADLLEQIRRVNPDRRLALFSEIRAEGVDARLAALFAAAGFRGFEIGLQTTHPEALKIMRRSTDIGLFLKGARLLKASGISAAVDLIMGLPADTPGAFKRTVDFVADNELNEDVQLFPLTVLPGTEFRRRHKELGLVFEPHPPYTIERTASFDQNDFMEALDYAENRLDTAFFPPPDLDIAWRFSGVDAERQAADVYVRLGGRKYLNKLIVAGKRPLGKISELARRVTSPYQVFLGPQRLDPVYVADLLKILTAANPFCPIEVVLMEPADLITGMRFVDHISLQRPHFLDGDLRYLYPRPGNRAALVTIVSRNAAPRILDDMQRHVFWWQDARLPERPELEDLFELDGVLIDVEAAADTLQNWQDRIAPVSAELPYISFARLDLQRRWLALTAADDYANGIMDYLPGSP